MSMALSFSAQAQTDELLKNETPPGTINPATEQAAPAPSASAPPVIPNSTTPEIALPQSNAPVQPPIPVPADNTTAPAINAETPVNAPVAQQNTNTTPVQAQGENGYVPFSGEQGGKLNNMIKSLFYTDEETALFNSSAMSYHLTPEMTSSPGDTSKMIDQMTGGGQEPEHPPIMSYALNATLYPKGSKWTIWLNGNKLREENRDSADIRIISISDNSLTAITKLPKPVAYYDPDFKKQLVVENNTKTAQKENGYYFDYKSKDGAIKISSLENIVQFTIKLHQTFVVNQMKIYEGIKTNADLTAEAEAKYKSDNAQTSAASAQFNPQSPANNAAQQSYDQQQLKGLLNPATGLQRTDLNSPVDATGAPATPQAQQQPANGQTQAPTGVQPVNNPAPGVAPQYRIQDISVPANQAR